MIFSKKEIYYFCCDTLGRPTKCCGKKNSNNGLERPFIILSELQWNNSHSEEIFAIPISKSTLGNQYTHTINTDSIAEGVALEKLSGSRVLCDKLCRIKQIELFDRNTNRQGTLTPNAYTEIRRNVISFLQSIV